MVEHRSAESEGLRFDSSWGLKIVSLSRARDKTNKHLPIFDYRAQTVPYNCFLKDLFVLYNNQKINLLE